MKTLKTAFNGITEGFNPVQKYVVGVMMVFTFFCLTVMFYNLFANFSDIQNASFGLMG